MNETENLDTRRDLALELERVRLGLRKAARRSRISSDTEIAWRYFGVHSNAIDQIRTVLLDIANTALTELKEQGDPPSWLVDALKLTKDSLVAAPSAELPSAVRDLLRMTLGPNSASTVCELQLTGLSIVPDEMLPAVRCLAAEKPSPDDIAALSSNWGVEWRVFADTALVMLGFNPADISVFLAEAPLAAVDTYLSTLPAPPRPEHWSGRPASERRYLTARTHPLLLAEQDLQALDWQEELDRRKRAQDRADVPHDEVIDPAGSRFQQQAAFRRAYELTLARSFEEAWVQVLAFGKPPQLASPIEKEVINLRAYLTVVRAGDEKLPAAQELLRTIKRAPVAAKNLEWLVRRQRLTLNEREPVENPYLVLGVAHGAPLDEWRKAWMTKRTACRDDLDAMSAINKARDQIRQLDRDGSDGLGRVFVFPIDPSFLAKPPDQEPGKPQVLPRRTNDSDLHAALSELRSNALHELLITADLDDRRQS